MLFSEDLLEHDCEEILQAYFLLGCHVIITGLYGVRGDSNRRIEVSTNPKSFGVSQTFKNQNFSNQEPIQYLGECLLACFLCLPCVTGDFM